MAEECQWIRCETAASFLVKFGLRVLEVDRGSGAAFLNTPYEAEERKLCQNHLDQIRLHYVHVTATSIGETNIPRRLRSQS